MTYSECGKYVLRRVSGPFADSGQAVRAGGDRGSSNGQDRGQAMPNPTRIARIGHPGQMMTQISQSIRTGFRVHTAQSSRDQAG